jgi:site-specific DNA recombinase
MARTPRTAASNRIAVGYVRVSTDEQSLGPEAQRNALAKWATAQGVELVAVFEDHVSGATPLDGRPGLLAALDALDAHGAGVLLVAKRDRLARDVMLAAMIDRLAERKGARILCADGAGNGEGPEAMLMRGMIDLFAQYERALIRARTRAALAVKRGRGERTGEVPLGFRAEGARLEADAGEQAAVSRVRDLRAQGLSHRAIAERLTAEGIQSRGARWHPTTVARILSRP